MNKKISKTIYDFVLEWDGPVPVPTGPTPKICTFLKKCLYGQKYTVATLFVAMPLDMANSMGLYVVIPEKPYKTVNGQICVKSNQCLLYSIAKLVFTQDALKIPSSTHVILVLVRMRTGFCPGTFFRHILCQNLNGRKEDDCCAVNQGRKFTTMQVTDCIVVISNMYR